MNRPQRVAIVHEWLTSMRGGEKCVEALVEVFPDATIVVLVHHRGSVSATIERRPIRTSFIERLPFAATRFRNYLPLFPTAIGTFDMREFDLVISSNHCVAKGVRTDPHTLHICYCHAPMRYIWGLFDDYFAPDRAGLLTRTGMSLALGYLRRWDVRTASHPHHFVANSRNIRDRIREIYHRDADVIYPPVNTAVLKISPVREDYCFIVSALVPYKRVDLAVETFTRMGKRLVVVGDGPDLARLKGMAGSTVDLQGWQPDDVVHRHFMACKAVIFPGEEDFGIVPVEAMACGKPVVAYAKGGALETVVHRPDLRTGVLFHEQTPEALAAAVDTLDRTEFDQHAMRTFALGFDREVFKRTMEAYVLSRWDEFHARKPQSVI
jgi:glycosyltransferase involved in cell wall biosynthesis